MTKNYIKIILILAFAFLIFTDIPTPELTFKDDKIALAENRLHYALYENVTSISTPSGIIYKVYNPNDNTTIWYTKNLEQVEIMKGKT